MFFDDLKNLPLNMYILRVALVRNINGIGFSLKLIPQIGKKREL